MNPRTLIALAIIAVVVAPIIAPLAKPASAQTVEWIKTTRDKWGTIYYNVIFTVEVLAATNLGNEITLKVSIGGRAPIGINATLEPGTYYLYAVNMSVDASGYLWYYNKTASEWESTDIQLTEGEQMTISFADKSVTLTFKHTAATGTIRTSAPWPLNTTLTRDWKIVAPDLNKDPYVEDQFQAKVYVEDLDTGWSNSASVVFVETGANTGEFTPSSPDYAKIYETLGATPSDVNPGDRVRVTIVVPPYQDASTTETALSTIVTVFRTTGEIRVANATISKLYIEIYDPNEDKDSTSPDTVNVSVAFPNPVCEEETLSAKETGGSTGVFAVTLPLRQYFLNNCFNGTSNILTINYTDPDSKYVDTTISVTKEVPVTFYTASVKIQPSENISMTGEIKVIIQDQDLNEPDRIDVANVTLTPGGEIKDLKVSDSDTGHYANLTISVVLDNGAEVPLPVASTAPGQLRFVETEENSATFVARLDLSKIVDTERLMSEIGNHYITALKVIYTDLLTPEGVKEVTEEATVTPVSITIDRNVIPLSASNSIVVHVTVIDPSQNKNPYYYDSATIEWTLYNYTGGNVTTPESVSLMETGINTGVFAGSFSIDPGIVEAHPDLIGGKLVITYQSTIGTKTLEVPLKVYSASLSVNPTSVKYGDTIEVTVKDPEANADTTKVDQVEVVVSVGGTEASLTLTETGENTGVFKGTLCVKRSASVDSTPVTIEPHSEITFKYVDKTSPDTVPELGWSTDTYTKTVFVESFTGRLYVNGVEAKTVGTSLPTIEVGPITPVNITVTDADRNVDPSQPDKITVTLGLGTTTKDILLTETGASTGVFVNDTMTVEDLFRMFNPDMTRADMIGQQLYVYYVDPVTEAGTAGKAIAVVLSVRGWTGEIMTDKETYSVGSYMYITVKDPDRAGAGTIEVSARSTSIPLWATIYLRENGTNTGVFIGRIYIESAENFDPSLLGKVLFASPGDKITIVYHDPVNVSGKEEDVVKTVSVVAPAVVGKPAIVSEIGLLEPTTGAKLTAAKAGSMVLLAPKVMNNATTTVTIYVKIVVKDEQGVTVFIGGAQIPVPGGQEATVTLSWVPEKPGTYTVYVYVLKSITEQSVTLSPQLYYETKITVTK
ncbi:MAG: hypothetical protein ABWW69_05950 [Pyrodictiaceae archaeon]